MDQTPKDDLDQRPVELPVVPSVDSPTANSVETPFAPAEPTTADPLPEPQRPEPVNFRDSFISWQASEYVEHEKSTKWYLALGGITLVLVLVAIFLIKEYTFALLLVVMAVAVGMMAKKPAAQISYRIDASGVTIDNKLFRYDAFRAFGVIQEGAFSSVSLVPVKRFSPSVNLYFPQELGEQIVDTLGSVLPMTEIKPDLIDRFSSRLNF